MNDQVYEFLINSTGLVEIVGFGSYGEVKLAMNRKSGEIVAIKMIYNKNAKEQIDVHHKLHHHNIIKLLNYYYEKERNTTYMILQYASGGSLNQKIKESVGSLSKSLVHRYFRQICQAVKYLHDNGYMHRDIKPENILINKDNIKLCDFGFASFIQYRSTVCGTFEYMAPQMIQKKPYDYRIDIWALGILLFQMIQGKAPFKGNTPDEVIAEMKKTIHFSNRFEPVQIDLIKKILRVNAQNRILVKDILEHPYFKNFEGILQETKVEQPKNAKNLTELRVQLTNNKNFQEYQGKKSERKMDFLVKRLEKKEQIKKQQPREDFRQTEGKNYEEEEKQEKKEFRPYIPIAVQNNRTLVKTPLTKPTLTATTFQSSQQMPSSFNNSMHLPNTQTFSHNSHNVTIGTVSSKHLHNPLTNSQSPHTYSQQYLNNPLSRPNLSNPLTQNRSPTNAYSNLPLNTPNYWKKQ